MKSLGFYPVFCLRPPSRPQEGDDLLKEVKSLDVQRRASPRHSAAVAVPSSWGVLPSNTTVAPRCPNAPTQTTEKDCLVKSLRPCVESWLHYFLALRLTLNEHVNDLENGGNNNDFTELLGGLNNIPYKVLSTVAGTGCAPINVNFIIPISSNSISTSISVLLLASLALVLLLQCSPQMSWGL